MSACLKSNSGVKNGHSPNNAPSETHYHCANKAGWTSMCLIQLLIAIQKVPGLKYCVGWGQGVGPIGQDLLKFTQVINDFLSREVKTPNNQQCNNIPRYLGTVQFNDSVYIGTLFQSPEIRFLRKRRPIYHYSTRKVFDSYLRLEHSMMNRTYIHFLHPQTTTKGPED